jgi:hypothetical protein
VANVLVVGLLSFFLGYGVSAETGVEPGYFDAVETGGYGVSAAGGAAPEGVSEELQDYYNSLSE